MARRVFSGSRRGRSRGRWHWAGIGAAFLLVALAGGPDLATRLFDAFEGEVSSPASRSGPARAPEESAGVWSGTVTSITDGDTFRRGDRAVRLCGVNAPERGEAGYGAAGAELGRLIEGRAVECRGVGSGSVCDGRSRPTSYERVVATCFVGGRDVAAEMVRSGHAVDWPRYSGGYYGRE